MDKDDFEKLEKIEWIKMRAEDLRDEKKYKEAINLYNESMDEGLVDFSFYQGLYSCHTKLKDYDAALACLNKFDELPPINQKPNHKDWILRKKKELEKKQKR